MPWNTTVPDKDGTYLVTVNYLYVDIMDYINGHWLHYEDDYSYDMTNEVVAWMPMPKPYEQEV